MLVRIVKARLCPSSTLEREYMKISTAMLHLRRKAINHELHGLSTNIAWAGTLLRLTWFVLGIAPGFIVAAGYRRHFHDTYRRFSKGKGDVLLRFSCWSITFWFVSVWSVSLEVQCSYTKLYENHPCAVMLINSVSRIRAQTYATASTDIREFRWLQLMPFLLFWALYSLRKKSLLFLACTTARI